MDSRKSRSGNGQRRGPSSTYLALIDQMPLRPLRSERDYDRAAVVLDRLAIRQEGSLDQGEQDYLDTLTMLVEAFDRERHRLAAKKLDPLAAIKYLMEESGMTQASLGRLLGSRAMASLILNGHRGLSKGHIRKLAGHFKVSAELFL